MHLYLILSFRGVYNDDIFIFKAFFLMSKKNTHLKKTIVMFLCLKLLLVVLMFYSIILFVTVFLAKMNLQIHLGYYVFNNFEIIIQ